MTTPLQQQTGERSFIVLRIDETGNAAFVDGGGREHEMARILDEAAQKLQWADPNGAALFDLNGNKVGWVAVVDMRPVDPDPSGDPPPGTLRVVLDNTGESLSGSEEGRSRMGQLLRLAAANIREGASDFSLALVDESGNRKEYGDVVYASPEAQLRNGQVNLADYFLNNGVRKADAGYGGIADGEYRYVVAVGDFEFGYGLDAGPVYLVNARGEVADGYEDGDQIVREVNTSLLSKDELGALREVVEGSLSFEAFEKRFGDQDVEADDEPEA